VLSGSVYVSPRIAGALIGRTMEHEMRDDQRMSSENLLGDGGGHGGGGGGLSLLSPIMQLSPRQREVLQLIAEGRSTKEIAFDLGVSVKTVETHRRQMMDKLNLHSVAQLTKYAVREGITSVDR